MRGVRRNRRDESESGKGSRRQQLSCRPTMVTALFMALVAMAAGSAHAQSLARVSSVQLQRWQPTTLATTLKPMMPSGSRRTYKTEGVLIGFAVGIIAVPFAISSCNHSANGCSAQDKGLYIAGLPALGGAIGWLIGGRFPKGD